MPVALNANHLLHLKKCREEELIAKLLQKFFHCNLNRPGVIKAYHDQLLFFAAYPPNPFIYKLCLEALERIKTLLADRPSLSFTLIGSGLPSTKIHCLFSRPVAIWLVINFPASVQLYASKANEDAVRSIFKLVLPKIEYKNIFQGK